MSAVISYFNSSCSCNYPDLSQVGEEDMMAGLWRRRCSHNSTRVALSLLQLGMVERAQAVLGDLNGQVAAGQIMVRHLESRRGTWAPLRCPDYSLC